jgi:group I intron endonuclease
MEKQFRSGIYCIENLINGKKYVGKSIEIERRMIVNHYSCRALMNAIKKYGKENFKIYVIEYCGENVLDNKKILNKREIYWIKELHSHISEWGYNMTWGGSASPMEGMHHSQESKEKMRLVRKGKHLPEEHVRNMTKSKIGSHRSDKTKKLMSENHADFKGENHPSFDIKRKNATSKYYGICAVHVREKIYWRAQIKIDGIGVVIGTRQFEIDAARIYDKYVVEHNINRHLNFPEEYGRSK